MERNPLLERFFEALQEAVGRMALERRVRLREPRRVAAVDAAYGGELMASCALVWDLGEGRVLESNYVICRPTYPYVPGLLFLREGPPMLEALRGLSSGWELLLVDAHGLLHPRRAGLAVFLGLLLGKPSLGVAKSLMVGEEEGGVVKVGGEVLGYRFGGGGTRRFYVSPGYMIDVGDIPVLMESLGPGYPPALREADRLARLRLREALGQPSS